MNIINILLYGIIILFLILVALIFYPLFQAILFKIKYGEKVAILFFPIAGVYGANAKSLKDFTDSAAIIDNIIKKNSKVKIVFCNMVFSPLILIVDPKYAKEFLMSPDNYEKAFYFAFISLFEEGLFVALGEKWKKQRIFLGQIFTF